ncbi:hypothetical protein RKD44_001854 [Streptomyces collinus]
MPKRRTCASGGSSARPWCPTCAHSSALRCTSMSCNAPDSSAVRCRSSAGSNSCSARSNSWRQARRLQKLEREYRVEHAVYVVGLRRHSAERPGRVRLPAPGRAPPVVVDNEVAGHPEQPWTQGPAALQQPRDVGVQRSRQFVAGHTHRSVPVGDGSLRTNGTPAQGHAPSFCDVKATVGVQGQRSLAGPDAPEVCRSAIYFALSIALRPTVTSPVRPSSDGADASCLGMPKQVSGLTPGLRSAMLGRVRVCARTPAPGATRAAMRVKQLPSRRRSGA